MEAVSITRQQRIEIVQKSLRAWWRRHKRDMPWRRRPDAYATWVSEIMLQQTRVATVIPYFENFLRRFPSPEALARASLDDVLKAWEGLGYYSRARNLHRAAGEVVRRFGGSLPADVAQLRTLPGIGRYTAGAIASIAFGLDEPVLDGNVTRVLCRVFCIGRNPKETKVAHSLWSLARRLIPPGRAGSFNQALMDLGATLCVPRDPLCLSCPLRDGCLARERGRQGELPAKARRPPLPHQTIVAGVIRRRGRLLIDRRNPDGLLGGLWEFPGGKVEPGETLDEALRREVREEVGIEIEVGDPLAVVRHAYSHFRITLHAFSCTALAGRARALQCAAVRWVRPGELDQHAFPRANQRIIEALQASK